MWSLRVHLFWGHVFLDGRCHFFQPWLSAETHEKMLSVICRYGTIYCQSRRSTHPGLCDPQWSSSQYACSDKFLYHRDDSPHGFFSPLLKSAWALLSPCRVDTVILSALNLGWLCSDQWSFLYFSWTPCKRKRVFRIQSVLMNSEIRPKFPPAHMQKKKKKSR